CSGRRSGHRESARTGFGRSPQSLFLADAGLSAACAHASMGIGESFSPMVECRRVGRDSLRRGAARPHGPPLTGCCKNPPALFSHRSEAPCTQKERVATSLAAVALAGFLNILLSNLEKLLRDGVSILPSLSREFAPRPFFFDQLLRPQSDQRFTMAIVQGMCFECFCRNPLNQT